MYCNLPARVGVGSARGVSGSVRNTHYEIRNTSHENVIFDDGSGTVFFGFSSAMTTASALIIGDELLSGKVQDQNMPFLIAELRKKGIDLRSIHVLPDEVPVLKSYIRQASENNDYVFTSGGVGPTHDDRTLDAVAEAFDVERKRHEAYEEALRSIYDEPLNDQVLSMAALPEGIEMVTGSELHIPAVRFRNVYILPGSPKLFQLKFNAIRSELSSDRSFYCHKVYLNRTESGLAPLLEELQDQFPEVDYGSYPSFGTHDYSTMVTLESSKKSVLEQALESFRDRLDDSEVVRVDEE